MAKSKRASFRPKPVAVIRARKRWRKRIQKMCSGSGVKIWFDHGICFFLDPYPGNWLGPRRAVCPTLQRPDAKERAEHMQLAKPEREKKTRVRRTSNSLFRVPGRYVSEW